MPNLKGANAPLRVSRISLPPDLVVHLLEQHAMGFISTFNIEGIPFIEPIHFVYPKEPDCIIIAVDFESKTSDNLIWQKKINLCFLGPDNIAYSVIGHAGIVKAPSQVCSQLYIFRIDVIDIECEREPYQCLEKGIKWEHRSKTATKLTKYMFEEFKDLVKKL